MTTARFPNPRNPWPFLALGAAALYISRKTPPPRFDWTAILDHISSTFSYPYQ